MKFGAQASGVGVTSVAMAALLASCQAPAPKPGPSLPPVAPPAMPAVSGRLFRIVPAESEVRIFVYRTGSLAKLGHNHVITSHDLLGTVTVPDDPTQTQFEIVMPVVPLAVDEPEQRAEEGTDFSTEVSDSARDGTHKNMLKPEVLDGEHYPAVTVRSTSIARAGENYDVVFEVELRGLKHELKAPVHVAIEAEQLTATGELSFNQTDLGITPFMAALGALAIKDEVRVKFNINATLSAL
jgi:hypothetical protein